jgi:hypothetical protein
VVVVGLIALVLPRLLLVEVVLAAVVCLTSGVRGLVACGVSGVASGGDVRVVVGIVMNHRVWCVVMVIDCPAFLGSARVLVVDGELMGLVVMVIVANSLVMDGLVTDVVSILVADGLVVLVDGLVVYRLVTGVVGVLVDGLVTSVEGILVMLVDGLVTSVEGIFVVDGLVVLVDNLVMYRLVTDVVGVLVVDGLTEILVASGVKKLDDLVVEFGLVLVAGLRIDLDIILVDWGVMDGSVVMDWLLVLVAVLGVLDWLVMGLAVPTVRFTFVDMLSAEIVLFSGGDSSDASECEGSHLVEI